MAVAFIVLACGGSNLDAQTPGAPDPSFSLLTTDDVAALIVQPADGKIVVSIAGQFGSFDNQTTGSIVRLKPDGTLDPNFHNADAGALSPGDFINATAFAMDANNKILVAGSDFNLNESVVVRLNTDGTVDQAFTPFVRASPIHAVAVQADGTILIGGEFGTDNPSSGLVRVDATGKVDDSFVPYIGPADAVSPPVFQISQVTSIVLLPDSHQALIGGLINQSGGNDGLVASSLARLNTDGAQTGSPDLSFGPVVIPTPYAVAIARQPVDGNIVIGAIRYTGAGNPGDGTGLLYRVNGTDGKFDDSFQPETAALQTTGPLAVVVQSGGRIIVGGGGYPLVAFQPNGRVDRDFRYSTEDNTNGSVNAMALQPDGNLVIGGSLPVAAYGASNAGIERLLTGTPASGTPVRVLVPGTADVWLAADGATDTNPTGTDTFPEAAPVRVAGLNLSAGATVTFGVTGLVNSGGAAPSDPPDGVQGSFYPRPAQNGLSGVVAPVDALLGVFVDDSAADPTNASAAPSLNFDPGSGGIGIDFASLQPRLNQVFFIGDGLNASGAVQPFTVPVGAKHLVLGTMDSSGWSNNTGAFAVTVSAVGGVTPSGPILTVSPDDFSYAVKGQAANGIIVPGDVITYTLVVRNTGAAPATHLAVKVTFDPNETKLKSVSDGGTAAGSVITWNLPSLENGDHHTFTYTVKVKANVDTSLDFHVAAHVLSATADAPAVALNATTATDITLALLPLFNISVSNNGASTAAGGPLTFTFTVSNRGSGPVNNISVYVPLPGGYVPANFKTAQLIDGNGNPIGSPFKLGAASNGGTDQNAVLVTVPSLAAGQVQQFIVTVNVPYSAPPSSDVTLPVVQLTGYQSDGSQVTFAQANYVAKISNQPPAALPNLALLKIVPTAGNIQTLQALANLPAGTSTAPLFKAAKQLFTALAASTGTSTSVLLATPADKLAQMLNPYVSRDTDAASGDSLFDVPSPNAKQTAPYVTYLLLYFNAGDGAAAGITISDTVARGLQLDPASINVKGAALTSTGSVVGSDGRSLTFAFGQIKPGVGGAILYRAFVPAPGAGGPNLGDTILPVTASLTTASLSNQVFDTPLESLLITGKANCLIEASENDPGDGTAVYNIYYRNTGGQKSNDLVIVSEVPTGGTFVSAHFLNFDQTERAADTSKGETIHTPTTENTNGKVIFELGKVIPRDEGFVQVTYKLTAASLALNPAGLTHHYYVDGSSFPGSTTVNHSRLEQPTPRVAGQEPRPRSFSIGSLLGSIKDGFANVGHAIINVFHHGDASDPGAAPGPVAPTIWLSRVAPLAVQENTDFTYLVTVGNCGQTPAYKLVVSVDLPTGATFQSSTSGSFSSATNFFMLNLDSLAPGQSQTVTLTFHATAAAGSLLDSDTCTASGFGGTSSQPVGTGSCDVGATSSLVYSASQAANFGDLKADIVANAARSSGVDPLAVTGGLLYPDHLAAVTPQSSQTTIAHADYLTTTSGATIVAQGGGNIVAQGGGNIVAQGGGNIILNDVAGFSGPVSVAELLSANGLGIVAQGGGNIVAQGGGNIVAQGGGNIIDFQTGNSLVSTNALPFDIVAAAGLGNARSENLIGQDGNGLIGQDGNGLISQDGNGLVSQRGGGLYAVGGAALQGRGSSGIAQRLGGQPIRRAVGIPAGTTLGSPTNSIHLDFNDAGSLVFGVGGSQAVTQSRENS